MKEDGFFFSEVLQKSAFILATKFPPKFKMLCELKWRFKCLVIHNCVFGSQGPQDYQICLPWQQIMLSK